MNKKVAKFLTGVGTAVLVSACAVTPDPITDAERAERAVSDLEAMFEGQEPVEGPISLSQAIARAVKYNLDHRVTLMEKAVARAEADLARMDLLPQITADAGYSRRSNLPAVSAESVLTGEQSLEPSIFRDKDGEVANLNVVWNVLDFGVSYITAQQRADRALIVEEWRRKAVQNIVQDVRAAYWKAVTADRLAQRTDALVARAEAALAKSEAMEEKGVETPLTSMVYQEGLLDTLRTLWRLRERLNTAKTELASLMNIRPGTDFELKPDDMERELPEINTVVPELEEYGLLHRPELIEDDYRLQIGSAEIRKAMLRMLPGLEINAGVHYDSNDFLVNNDWADAGLRISWNLFNLLRGPKDKKLAEAQMELDEARRLATGMAVLTQVNVAHQRYRNARQDYEFAGNLLEVKMDIAEQERRRFRNQASDELSLIQARLDRLVARLQRDMALAELQNAAGRVHNSIGLDPLPPELEADDLETLTEAVATHQASLKQMLAQPQLDLSLYDAIAREIARERAKKRREEALAKREAAKQKLAEAARRKAEREARAAQAAEQALAEQQQAVEAAAREADARRRAEEEAARQSELLEEKRKAAEEARRAAEKALAAAREAEEEARKAAQARQARLAEIARRVEAEVSDAVEASLSATEAQKGVWEAEQAIEEAQEQVEDIEIPQVPEPLEPGAAPETEQQPEPGETGVLAPIPELAGVRERETLPEQEESESRTRSTEPDGQETGSVAALPELPETRALESLPAGEESGTGNTEPEGAESGSVAALPDVPKAWVLETLPQDEESGTRRTEPAPQGSASVTPLPDLPGGGMVRPALAQESPWVLRLGPGQTAAGRSTANDREDADSRPKSYVYEGPTAPVDTDLMVNGEDLRLYRVPRDNE